MRLLLMVLLAPSLLLLGCPGGGGPGTPPPTPTINSVTPTGDIGFVTDAITFTADITGTVTSYQWTFNGGFSLPSSDVAAPAGTLDVAGSFGGSLIACNGNECSDPFAFSYRIFPDAPPTVTAVLPARLDWPRGTWITLDVEAEGLPDVYEWTAKDPANHNVTFPDPTQRQQPLSLAVVGTYQVTVRASNRFGFGPPVTASYTASLPTHITEAEITAFDLFGRDVEFQPEITFDYGERVGVVWNNEDETAITLSTNSAPATASDFTQVPLPPGVHRIFGAVMQEGHLILATQVTGSSVQIAIADQTVPADPSSWTTYVFPGFAGAWVTLTAGEGGLALTPPFARGLNEPLPVALSSVRIPRAASDWRIGSLLDEGKSSWPYHAAVSSDGLVIFGVTGGSTDCFTDPYTPGTRRLTCASILLSADPADAGSWHVGTVLESAGNHEVAGTPLDHQFVDGQLVIPVSRGRELRLATAQVAQPMSPTDWRFEPPLDEPPFFPFPDRVEACPTFWALGTIGFLGDDQGRQTFFYQGFEGEGALRFFAEAATVAPADPARLTSRLGGIWNFTSHTGSNGEDFSYLHASPAANGVRVVLRHSDYNTRVVPPFPGNHYGIAIRYLAWPTP